VTSSSIRRRSCRIDANFDDLFDVEQSASKIESDRLVPSSSHVRRKYLVMSF